MRSIEEIEEEKLYLLDKLEYMDYLDKTYDFNKHRRKGDSKELEDQLSLIESELREHKINKLL